MAAQKYSWSDRNADDATSTGLITPGGVTALLLGGGGAAATSSSQQALSTTSAESSAVSATTTTNTTGTAAAAAAATSLVDSSQTTKTIEGDNNNNKCYCHTLFVWDFDWTIVNCNSDGYIPAQFLGTKATTLGFRNLYTNGNPSTTKGNWHACVEQMVHRAVLQLVHRQQEQGDVSVSAASPTERIMGAARHMPFLIPVQETLEAIDANNPSTGQMILSDGNTLFLNAFLQHNVPHVQFTHGVISNHGSWKKQKMHNGPSSSSNSLLQQEDVVVVDSLCVVHQSQQYGGHDCRRCSANLCKSQALREALKDYYYDSSASVGDNSSVTMKNRRHHRPRIVYIGDGANDACPVLNVLEQGDVLLARVGRKRLHANDCKGPESDHEAMTNKHHHDGDDADHKDDGDAELEGAACFGIMPALDKAKQENPNTTPGCQAYEWTNGAVLKQLVLKLLQELPPQQQEDEE